MMPGVDGWAFRQAQLAQESLAAISVVGMSASYRAKRSRAAHRCRYTGEAWCAGTRSAEGSLGDAALVWRTSLEQEARMIDRYGSMRQPMGLRQLMDRLMEDAFIMPREGGSQGWGGPAMDVYEEGDNLVVEAHLPGLKAEDLEVQVEQGMLTISGRTEAEQERKERNYLVREQRMGRFTRSLQLPPSYNTENCESQYEHGGASAGLPEGRGGEAPAHPDRHRRAA
jgi:HSP20 family protein